MKRIYALLAACSVAIFTVSAFAAPQQAAPEARRVTPEELRLMGIDPESMKTLPSVKLANATALPYPAPTLRFRSLDGKEIGPKEFEGKVVLIDFWATWCGYCAKARPEVEAIATRHASAPFTRVSISADQSESVLRKFLAAHPGHAHQVWDGDRQLLSQFRVSGFPTHLLINPSGQVVHLMNGWGAGSRAGLESAITAELRKVAAASPRAKT